MKIYISNLVRTTRLISGMILCKIIYKCIIAGIIANIYKYG